MGAFYYLECEGPNCHRPMWMVKIKDPERPQCVAWHPFDWTSATVKPPPIFERLTLTEIMQDSGGWVSHFSTCPNADLFRQQREAAQQKREAKAEIKKQQGTLF